jgi:predicted acetyltransferase
MPHLVPPTASVRDSYLDGERAAFEDERLDDSILDRAQADFDSFVHSRRRVRKQWDVPVTELWFVEGSVYIGTVIIRHRLTPVLRKNGGHIGFHVVPRERCRGYAKQMLGEALKFCGHLGLNEIVITCDVTNAASRRVIEANGGRLEGTHQGTCSYKVLVPDSVLQEEGFFVSPPL